MNEGVGSPNLNVTASRFSVRCRRRRWQSGRRPSSRQVSGCRSRSYRPGRPYRLLHTPPAKLPKSYLDEAVADCPAGFDRLMQQGIAHEAAQFQPTCEALEELVLSHRSDAAEMLIALRPDLLLAEAENYVVGAVSNWSKIPETGPASRYLSVYRIPKSAFNPRAYTAASVTKRYARSPVRSVMEFFNRR